MWTLDLHNTTETNAVSANGKTVLNEDNRMLAFIKSRKDLRGLHGQKNNQQLEEEEYIQPVICGDHKLKGTAEPSVAWVSEAGLSGDKSMFYCNSKAAQHTHWMGENETLEQPHSPPGRWDPPEDTLEEEQHRLTA